VRFIFVFLLRRQKDKNTHPFGIKKIGEFRDCGTEGFKRIKSAARNPESETNSNDQNLKFKLAEN